MLLNEPTPHPTRPAAATAPPAQHDLPTVEMAGAPAPPRTSAAAAPAGAEASDADAISTVSLDVAAVKRAVNSDATATVSLNVAGVKQAMGAPANGAAQAPTVAFAPVKVDQDGDIAAVGSEPPAEAADSDSDAEALAAADRAADADAHADAADPAADSDADVADTADTAVATAAYLASTDLAFSTSTTVAMPETADDVIATIHAAATAVAAADRRARQASFVKADPWTGLDLHQPAAPAPVDNVLDLLAPVLERPLLVVEQPGLPEAADVVALHRCELELDFVEPPVVAAGAEPPIPPRYGPGLSVLPHIEFPV